MDNKESFCFTYSAARQQEVENIRKKYLPKEEDKLEQLRKLHHSASHKAQAWAIGTGVIGALLLGTGMSLVMTDIGKILGITGIPVMLIGILIGLVGIALVGLAYPVYNKTLTKERTRIAPEILRLTDELLK